MGGCSTSSAAAVAAATVASTSGKKLNKNDLLLDKNCHYLQLQSFLETFDQKSYSDEETQKQRPNGASSKPQKFSISTKFLRKSRSKLKTARQKRSQSDDSDINNSFVFNNDDPNAKFKDFSIDSLLNK